MKKQMKLLTCLTKPFVLFLLLFALGVGQMWAWANRTYDGSTKLYIMNMAPSEWSVSWASGDDNQLWVCLKPQTGSETWYTPTLESGSNKYARGALYSITPPSGTYEYVKLKRGSSKDGDGTNTTNGIDFSSTTSNNLLKGWNTSNSTGDWGEIHPSPVTSDGTGILYFNMAPGSNNSNIDYDFLATKNFAFFYNNDHGEWSDQAVQVTDNYYRVHVPQGTWSGVILTRHGDVSSPDWSNVYQNNDGKKNQSTDITFTDNHNYISAWYENKYAGVITATMSDYVPASTYVLNGSMNGWNMLSAKYFDEGSLELSLPAHKTYSFKIIEGNGSSGTWKGLYDSNCIVSTMAKWGCSGSVNIPINTAGAGTYTFEYNTTDGLSVTYPTASHPSMDYVYLIDYSWSDPRIHFPSASSSGVSATNNGGQQLELSGTSSITNTVTISDQQYFYAAVGEYSSLYFHKNGDNVNNSGQQTPELGHRLFWNGAAWGWGTLSVWIGLDRRGANNGDDHIDTEFNDPKNLPSRITTPTKDYYEFDGYYTEVDGGGYQIIDKNGDWIEGAVPGYKGESGEWIHEGSVSLYAKWDEVPYTITMAVSPSGAGTTSPASTATGKLVTASGDITATPAAGYKFKEWQFSKTDENYDVWCADGYSSTDATIHIKAQHNGTLTAVFEPRYSLVGSLQDNSGNGGMPGWEDYTKTFTVNSSSPVDLTRTCTLQANKTYKLQVHDLATSTNLGRSGCDPVCVLEENASLVMENSNNDVFLYTGGAGEYIFKITAVDGSGHPTLTVLRPYPVNFGQKYLDIDGALHTGTTGGSATATAGGNALTSGDYVTYNTSVTHTATATSPGYTFAGWWSSDAFEGAAFSNTNPMTYVVTSGDNTYAKFVETSTSVSLSNDGHGKVQIGGEDATSTTCGVTTTRELTAVPNEGYKFSSWSKSGDDITLSSTSTNPTTLSGNGSGATSGQTVTANFTYRWALKAESDGWGSAEFIIGNISTNGSGDVVGYVEIPLAANTNYQFTITDKQESATYKSGSDKVYYMTNGNSYVWDFSTSKTYNCGITTAGAGTYRFMWNITDKTMSVIYPNFVIYRSGDKDEDSESATHTTTSTVESYDGGTIAQGIEFRMKVRELDKWYTLCLPFEVNKVCVWDAEDGKYYEMKPYYRPTPGGTFYTGHYVIRTPYGENVTGPGIEIELENFDDWRDPVNASVLPSASTPYIIQWHHDYFQDRYISFFGAGTSIPNGMTSVDAPTENDKVRVCGNDAMKEGEVAGAYLLDNDYGSGAWLRDENVETVRTINPFECYIIASDETTGRYLAIRRGMTTDDTPTGWDDVLNSERKQIITVYTLSGFQVTQYNDCSFNQAAQRLHNEQNEGIFILRSENESIKLMVGGK